MSHARTKILPALLFAGALAGCAVDAGPAPVDDPVSLDEKNDELIGDACGSRGLPACGTGTYCNYAPSANCGRTDIPGTCAVKPWFCKNLYNPVCGCDGVTYTNACVAAKAGVSVEHTGPCCVAPPPNMKAWWSFDETSGTTAYDLIGGNHGTWQNGPLPVAGKVAGALWFDGVNDRVWAPLVGTHDYKSLTIDAWIKVDAIGGTQKLLEYGSYVYGLQLEGSELRFWSQPSPYSFAPLSSGANIQPGVWTFVAVTANAAGGVTFYVNGNAVSTAPQYNATGFYSNPNWGFEIGGAAFKGAIDELEIFERPLTASEIHGLWAAGPSGKCKGGLVGTTATVAK